MFENNLVYDVNSTATFFFGNWADSLGGGPSEYCEDILQTGKLSAEVEDTDTEAQPLLAGARF